MPVHTKARQRPAETGAFSLAVVAAAALSLFNVSLSDQQFQALLVILGVVPAVITWIVARRATR